MSKIAIIGGSGLTTLPGCKTKAIGKTQTPYGPPSAELCSGISGGQEILFLPRHGNPHTIPPQKINSRANVPALKVQDTAIIFAINTVGGITAQMSPGTITIPTQIIDYSHGREHTFHDGTHNKLAHIDFSNPYSPQLCQTLHLACAKAGVAVVYGSTYATTQGPRLETAAEIKKLEQDGCNIVGMTGMPEAALAAELEMHYACLALIVNWAAGKTTEKTTRSTIETHQNQGMNKILKILQQVLTML